MQLKIISSNIRYENDLDGIQSWENRRPLLQKIFNDFAPDILGTQEGRFLQTKSLANNLNLKLVESHRTWIENRMYPCLYLNEKKINLHNSGDVWLSQTPHLEGSTSFKSAFPRLCTWMKITHIESNLDYIVLNTHLDHVLEETRIEQINVLIHEIKLINDKNLPLILLGDFNDAPSSMIRKTIIEKLQLKDPWIELALPEETTHHAFLGDKGNGERIDWILIPENFKTEEIFLEKRSFNSIYPSDHYPLLATLIPR